MLKKYVHLTIIVMIQCIVPILTLMIIIPFCTSQPDLFKNVQLFLSQWKYLFLWLHALFDLLICLLWPKLINTILKKQHNIIGKQQYKTAIQARWYLLGTLIALQLLMLWRA